jgi:predicted Zn-dependent protease
MPNRIPQVRSSVFASVRGSALPAICAAAVAFAPMLVPAAEAQNRRQTVIRDTEIEKLLRDYAEPIFTVAGTSSRDADIIIVLDQNFNAFVASGRRMVIHTGTLLQSETPNEVIGVIAHETGHLAGGHLENLRNEVARAQAIGAIVSMLGVAGMVAGTAAGVGSTGRMGAAATTMGPGVAQRSLLSYRRTQELAADRAGLSYLNATRQSARGMVKTFERFADQQLFSARYADPYAQTHPMARDRLQQLEKAAHESPYWEATDSPQLQLRHDMMRAKLSAFSESPRMVGRRYPPSDKSIPAQYARAVVAYRTGGLRDTLRTMDALIARVPTYPYFHELKGQALLESGRAAEAVAPLRQAVALAPDAGLIRIMLGHALLQTENDSQLDEAISYLITGLDSEPLSADGYRHLATAYRRQGRVADAELATADGLLIEGDVESAKNFAHRAQAKFSRGSPGWLKAEDIINYQLPGMTN